MNVGDVLDNASLNLVTACPGISQLELQKRHTLFLPWSCLLDDDQQHNVGHWALLDIIHDDLVLGSVACQLHPIIEGICWDTFDRGTSSLLLSSSLSSTPIGISPPLSTLLSSFRQVREASAKAIRMRLGDHPLHNDEIPSVTNISLRRCRWLPEYPARECATASLLPPSRTLFQQDLARIQVVAQDSLLNFNGIYYRVSSSEHSSHWIVGVTRSTTITIIPDEIYPPAFPLADGQEHEEEREENIADSETQSDSNNKGATISMLRPEISAASWVTAATQHLAAHRDIVASIIERIEREITSVPEDKVLESSPLAFLLSGLSGSGKTTLAETLLRTSHFPGVRINAVDLFTGIEGESERLLFSLFTAAMQSALRAARAQATETMQKLRVATTTNENKSATSKPRTRDVGMGEMTGREKCQKGHFGGACVVMIDDIETLSPLHMDQTTEGNEDGISSGRSLRIETRLVAIVGALIEAANAWVGRIPVRLPRDDGKGTDLHVFPARIVIVATCGGVEKVHPSLCSPRRLAVSIPLGVLNLSDRIRALTYFTKGIQVKWSAMVDDKKTVGHDDSGLHQGKTEIANAEQGQKRVAELLHGFVVADIKQFVSEAYVAAAQRIYGDSSSISQSKSVLRQDGVEVSVEVLPCDLKVALAQMPTSTVLRSSEHRLNISGGDRVADRHRVQKGSLSSCFNHLGGIDDAVKRLHTAIIWPLVAHEQWRMAAQRCAPGLVSDQNSGLLPLHPASGVLIYGPSGCGKTALALALAQATSIPVLSASAATLVSKVVGASEQGLRDLFRQAKASSPCLLLLDEVETICSRKSSDGSDGPNSLLTTLLYELDQLSRDRSLRGQPNSDASVLDSLRDEVRTATEVIVVATTSYPKKIPHSLLRQGRLSVVVGLKLPDATARHHILAKLTEKMPMNTHSDTVEVESSSSDTITCQSNGREGLLYRLAHSSLLEGATPADLRALCTESAMIALREAKAANGSGPLHNTDALVVTESHFNHALEQFRRTHR